jgi:protein SCO1
MAAEPRAKKGTLMRLFVRFFLYLAAPLFAVCTSVAAESNSPWGSNYFPNLPVVTQDGKTLHFYDDVIKGKTVVVSFIYTSCPDICPLTTARMAMVKDELGTAMGRDVFFVSITVDPETDTPERMKAFADAFNTGPGWLFLTGKPSNIFAIVAKFGNTSTVKSEHRNEIILGNDLNGDWQRDSPLGDIASVVANIRAMSPTLTAQATSMVSTGGSTASVPIAQHPGETLFRKLCTPCHTVGVGNRVGPDLRDVTSRRAAGWLSAFIISPGKVRKSGDPIALELNKKFPGVKMPEMGLSADDAQDLITYMKAATERLAVASEEHDHMAHEHDHSTMAPAN